MRKELLWNSILGLGSLLWIIFIILTQTSSVPSSPGSNSVQTGIPIQEVQKHNSSSDCWLIINNNVYDVTTYLSIHPGGSERIIQYCGNDATDAFNSQGGRGSHSQKAIGLLRIFFKGNLIQ